MPAATILFMDMVGFSMNPNSRQIELIDSFTLEVVSSLSSLINPLSGAPHVVAMPTGDGMALAFLHKPQQPWDSSTIMGLIYRVQQWAKSADVSLRTGVHVGEISLVTDINNKTNIVGDAINYTQRVMDAANPRQTLFSDTAFRQYIGSNNPCYSGAPYSPSCKAIFDGPFDVQAKHEMRMLVYKMALDPPQAWLSNDDPVSNRPAIIDPSPYSLRKRRITVSVAVGVVAVIFVAVTVGTVFSFGTRDNRRRVALAPNTITTSPGTPTRIVNPLVLFDEEFAQSIANRMGMTLEPAELLDSTRVPDDWETPYVYKWWHSNVTVGQSQSALFVFRVIDNGKNFNSGLKIYDLGGAADYKIIHEEYGWYSILLTFKNTPTIGDHVAKFILTDTLGNPNAQEFKFQVVSANDGDKKP